MAYAPLLALAVGLVLATAAILSVRYHRARVCALEAELARVRDAHRALQESERRLRSQFEAGDRLKSDFVSFVSHQLRTPLCGVSWILELAAETPNLSRDVAGHIDEARESARRLIRLVNDLLDVSRLESGRLPLRAEPLQLGAVVASAADELKPLIEARGLRLTIDARASDAIVSADLQLIRQAIANLLSNAAKYTPAGGRIEVVLSRREGTVSCAVRDTGIGVPREAQSRLFEKFFRADNAVVMESEGTGLGLRLVQLVVEQSGGRVWCESEPGRGSIFTMELPELEARALAAGPRPAAVHADR